MVGDVRGGSGVIVDGEGVFSQPLDNCRLELTFAGVPFVTD